MAYGEKPQLTPGRLALILVCLVILTAVSVWHLLFRDIPPAMQQPAGLPVVELSGETIGTYYLVKVFPEGPQTPTPLEMEHAIQRQLNLVDRKMSTYRTDSELSQFNQFDSREPFTFSEETFEVIQLSQRISEQTDGAFDITVGPLVNAWGFGPEGAVQAPTEQELARLRQRVGYQLLSVDPVARTVSKAHPEIYLDLSAVAKGYAVDRVAAALDDLSVENYMVEVGGEVRTNGVNAEGHAWQIGIEVPDDTIGGVQRVIGLSGMAMATSGDYRNYYERDGVIYSHTIDPRTGRPVPHSVASATVIHHECVYADALATALVVMGADEGLALAQEMGLPVLFVIHKDDGLEERPSPAFTAFL